VQKKLYKGIFFSRNMFQILNLSAAGSDHFDPPFDGPLLLGQRPAHLGRHLPQLQKK
jgi:hypothetical protein